MSVFPIVDDCLEVGGMPLTRLADRVGSTPFYAYSSGCITERLEQLRLCLPKNVEIHYAVKANPMPALMQHMATLVDGFDVASQGEMKVALDTGMPAEKISFAGPGKTPAELSSAIAAGVIINLESKQELERVIHLGRAMGYKPKVAVRVNPDFELRSSGMKMGGGPKPFGVDAEDVPAMLLDIHRSGIEFMGFHIYSGSQNLKAEALIEAHEKTFELAARLARGAPEAPLILNIGGGFGIPYFPGEKPLDLGVVGTRLRQIMNSFSENFPDTQVVIELGRYLVGEAGIYVCRVIDRKISRGQVFLVTDGGMHHHLAASGNFGQVIRKNYPVVVGNKILGTARETVSVVGPLCTPLDILADRMDLAEANIGDLIVVFQSGAYGATASPSAFLGHPAVTEVFV